MSRLAYLLCIALTSVTLADPPDDRLLALRTIRLEHPKCYQPTSLSVTSESFVLLGNDLPGVTEYNELIRTFHKKEWRRLDDGVARFLKMYENTPLREASSLLLVVSEFERLPASRPEEAKEADKLMREFRLLYPNSQWTPALLAVAGNFWLKNGFPERALSSYQEARNLYPFHPISCVVQMGMAESSFALGDLRMAASSYQQLLQKCQNKHLRIGSQVRLAEIGIEKKKKESRAQLAALYQENSRTLEKFFPDALLQLAESKYWANEYSKANFFLGEYLDARPASESCLLYASKRLADIAFESGAKLEQAAGLYLAVKERGAESDAGRYSNVRALLLNFPSVPAPEQERRLKYVDQELERVQDKSLRSAGYLEKGLAMLAGNREGALEYLVHYTEKSPFESAHSLLAGYVRESVMRHVGTLLDDKRKEDGDKNSKLKPAEKMARVERTFNQWLAGTNAEKRGRADYERYALQTIESSLEQGKFDDALALMRQWRSSIIWPKVDAATKVKIGSLLVRSLHNSAHPDAAAGFYLRERATIATLLSPSLESFWLGCQLLVKEPTTKKAVAQTRTPSSLRLTYPADVVDYLTLVHAEALLNLKENGRAEALLRTVSHPNVKNRLLQTKLRLYEQTRAMGKAFATATELIARVPPAEQAKLVEKIGMYVQEGKLWSKAEEIAGLNTKLKVEPKDRAPLFYLLGRCYYERGKCVEAIRSYEDAIELNAGFMEMPGSKFRLGKCLAKLKRKDDARRVWDELVSSKDTFWSPLAQNEIRILK